MSKMGVNVLWGVLLFVLIQCASGAGKLDVSGDKLYKVVQRGKIRIKGSSGDINVLVGDVTGGKVKITIEGVEDSTFYFSGFLSQLEDGYFQYGDGYYSVRVKDFELHLMHDDYAFISLQSVSDSIGEKYVKEPAKSETPMSHEEMRMLMYQVKKSELTFMEAETALRGWQMFKRLTFNFDFNDRDIKTQEDFVEKVLEHSKPIANMELSDPSRAAVGKFQVVLNTGEKMGLKEWLGL